MCFMGEGYIAYNCKISNYLEIAKEILSLITR